MITSIPDRPEIRDAMLYGVPERRVQVESFNTRDKEGFILDHPELIAKWIAGMVGGDRDVDQIVECILREYWEEAEAWRNGN